MNRAQLSKYHVTKSQWAAARTARKMPADAAALAALQQRTIGRACSSTTFSQTDLDRMLAAFLAESKPDDLNAQINQIDQPMVRRLAMEKRLLAAGAKFITGNDAGHVQARTINYVQGIVQNLGAAWNWPIYDEPLLAQVTGIMERRAAQVARKASAPQLTPQLTPQVVAVHSEEAPLF